MNYESMKIKISHFVSQRSKFLQHLVWTDECGAAVDDPLAAARRGDGQVDGARLGTGRGGGGVGHQVLVLGVVAPADDEDDGVLGGISTYIC